MCQIVAIELSLLVCAHWTKSPLVTKYGIYTCGIRKDTTVRKDKWTYNVCRYVIYRRCNAIIMQLVWESLVMRKKKK